MSDLREAAKLALIALENGTSPNLWLSTKENLRQALAQPEQEPVAWVYNGILHEFDPSEFATSEVKPLYTAPPKREWVGLEDEDVATVKNEFNRGALWAEQILKEKNT